ncbi:MAG: ribosome silencing factor [Brumimicrobium sp.]
MIVNKKEIDSSRLCEVIVEGMRDNKAENIVVIDLREIENTVTDFFVIATGNSTVHISGIADAVVRLTRKQLKERPWNVEGKTNAQWVLLDYVNVVAHIFMRDVREFYELEQLWADGKVHHIKND